MDAKDTWPVVKFLIAATGFKRRDARKLLEEIPEESYSQLFVRARAWDRDQAAKASDMFSSIVGEANIPTLLDAARMARTPAAGKGADGSEDDGEDEPQQRKPAKKSRR